MNPTRLTEIIVIRHAQTLWNTEGRHQGHLDGELSPLGIHQAQAVADRLANTSFAALYSSDLKRAVQTAEPIAQACRQPIRTDPRLRERDYGVFRGLTIGEIKVRYPAEYGQFLSGDPDYAMPEGESARQKFDRSIECAEGIVEANLGRRVVVVTHGGVLDALFRHTCGVPLSVPRRFKLYNASLNTFFVYDHVWTLASWGDVTHLSELETIDEA